MFHVLATFANLALGVASFWTGASLLFDAGVRADAGGSPGVSSVIGIFGVVVGTISVTASLMVLAWTLGTAIADHQERRRSRTLGS